MVTGVNTFPPFWLAALVSGDEGAETDGESTSGGGNGRVVDGDAEKLNRAEKSHACGEGTSLIRRDRATSRPSNLNSLGKIKIKGRANSRYISSHGIQRTGVFECVRSRPGWTVPFRPGV